MVRCIVMFLLRWENLTSISFRGFRDRCQYLQKHKSRSHVQDARDGEGWKEHASLLSARRWQARAQDIRLISKAETSPSHQSNQSVVTFKPSTACPHPTYSLLSTPASDWPNMPASIAHLLNFQTSPFAIFPMLPLMLGTSSL